MKKAWELNKKELYMAYKNKNTPFEEKLRILELMYFNIGYKSELFEKVNMTYFNDLETCKKKFLNMMRKDYYSLGESFIRYIIELNRLNIFRCDTLEPIYKNNMNKVASITMDLYSKYSSGLYKIAKKIIDDNCVLICEDLDVKSYMTFLKCINKPFCVVDKSDSPNTLIHELEHAIEALQRYRIPRMYDELGPITFETLFIDEMVELKIRDSEELYFSRIRESNVILKDLSKYFKAILYAKNNNFDMTNSKFISMMTIIMSIDKSDIINYLNDIFIQNIYEDELLYFLSFIKSIELRNSILDDKKMGLRKFRECLNGKDISFNEKENFKNVKQYIKEISKKNKN